MNLLLGGAAAYGLALAGLYLLQESLLFPRGAARLPAYPLPAGTELLELETPGGHTIRGHLLRARVPPGTSSRGLLLGFPGNAWNAGDCLAFLDSRAAGDLGLDIAVFHYRGYAPSDGTPGERALFEDALLVHDTLVERLRPPKVFAAGFSLGSAVAAYLAKVRPLRGLVLVTPFDSIQAIARQRYFWAPVGALLKHPFRSDRHLAGLDVPVAVITAEADRIVPKTRSARLVDVLARPVLVESIEGATHGTIYDDERLDLLFRRGLELVDIDAPALGAAAAAPAADDPDGPELAPSGV